MLKKSSAGSPMSAAGVASSGQGFALDAVEAGRSFEQVGAAVFDQMPTNGCGARAGSSRRAVWPLGGAEVQLWSRARASLLPRRRQRTQINPFSAPRTAASRVRKPLE